MRSLTGAVLLVLGGVLHVVSTPAVEAQVPIHRMSLNFTQIQIEYTPKRDAVPFGIDLTLHADGLLSGQLSRLWKATDVTLKRGIVGQVGEDARVVLTGTVAVDAPGGGAALGRLVVDLSGALSDASRAGDAVTFALPPWTKPAADEADDLGALMTFVMPDGAAELAQFHLRFEARPGEQLVGRPAALFNTPGPGEPLIARLPQLAPGEALDLVLVITNTGGSGGTLIPIRVKHNV
jgi:hypothetical protein